MYFLLQNVPIAAKKAKNNCYEIKKQKQQKTQNNKKKVYWNILAIKI